MSLKIVCIICIIYTSIFQSACSEVVINNVSEFIMKNVQQDENIPGNNMMKIDKPKLLETEQFYGENCAEAMQKSHRGGIYDILIPSFSPNSFKVACDATTQGGNWTVILQRLDGSVNFYRNWNSYKKGFGDLDGEFFLGLDKIHALTGERSQELLVLLEDHEGQPRHELYEKFGVGDENELYALQILGKASGTAGDALALHHGQKFSTYDNDNDSDRSLNCAEDRTGAWWYINCHHSNLAGQYGNSTFGKGINWSTFRGHEYSLKRAAMLIRPRK